jgi:hypothetical protein
LIQILAINGGARENAADMAVKATGINRDGAGSAAFKSGPRLVFGAVKTENRRFSALRRGNAVYDAPGKPWQGAASMHHAARTA